MLSASEIARGTQGAIRFLQRDPSAPYYFENNFEACLRSFRVMLLLAPLYAVYLVLHYTQTNSTAEGWEIAAVEAMRYVVDWLLFPVLFHEVARRRGWLDRYPRYIGALNWINVPTVALMVVAKIVAVLVPPVGQALEFALQVVVFYWFLTATRMVLGIGWPFAILLLIVNWVPSIFLSLIVDRVLGVGTLPA